MLTRDLLLYRVREGRLRPSFINVQEPALVELAKELLARVEAGRGEPLEELEEALGLRAGAFARPKVARGLVKLLVDRVECEEPGEGVAQARAQALRVAAQLRRELGPGESAEGYEAKLEAALGRPLAEVREGLYADLPGQRRVVGWEALGPRELLERYNLALAQGPLMEARRLRLRAHAPELLRVRKVLRWLRFCRLVAEVRQEEEDWALEVEGPGAVLAMHKRYGLQLALFLSVVPVLERWELEAPLEGRKRGAVLVLSQADPLVSPHPSALGHVPEEVAALAQGLEGEEWEVDLTPVPRHTGAVGLCVPDMTVRHRPSGREVALELFHAWHAGPLMRRLEELRSRPDPGLLLGVDRALAREAHERAALEAHPQVLLFAGMPSPRRVRARVAALLGLSEP